MSAVVRVLAVSERADQMQRENPDWRVGQAWFNALHEIDPGLANQIRGSQDDPFYRDDRVTAFVQRIEAQS